MIRPMIDAVSLDLLFRNARSHSAWQPREVPDTLLREMFDLARLGPTSANCSPARYVFVRTTEGKERLRPALSRGNVEKTMTAPVTVLVGYDTRFYEAMPFLFPHEPSAAKWFTSDEDLARETALRNASLQGTYLIMAARALGLDTGPLSGFDAAKVEAEFFPDARVKCNFICNLGYGDASRVFPRLPRFSFEQACSLA